MRTFILAVVLLLSLLFSGSAGASHTLAKDFDQALQNSAVDRMICDRLRYHHLNLPKIDAFAQAFVEDCLSKLRNLTEPRPIFYWNESIEEATTICNTYVAESRLDVSSDFLLITDTDDFGTCMQRELAP